MKVWIFEDVLADKRDVFYSEESMWESVLAYFQEDDETWTLEEVKDVVQDNDAYVVGSYIIK